MEHQMNPLLDFSGLPRFGAIEPVHVTPAVDALLQQARDVVRQVTDPKSPASWDAIVEPLDDATDRLGRAWGAVSHLNAVVDTPQLREQYNANQPKLTVFFTELSQDEALYARFKELAALPDFASWPAARRKVIENELRDFRLGGAELPADRKHRFKELCEREAQVSTRFAENVLDAINAFALYVDDAKALAGVPEDAVQMFAKRRPPRAAPATRSRCSTRATRRSSTTPTTGRCASSSIAPTSPRHRSSASPNGTTDP